jgi:hypothetical protein
LPDGALKYALSVGLNRVKFGPDSAQHSRNFISRH